MPSTSIYGINYPAATDLVANGYSQMQTLAGNVETVLQNQTQSLSTGYRNLIENPTFSQLQRPTITTTVADFWNYYVDNIAGVTNTRTTLNPTTGLPEWVSGSLTTAVASNAAGVARYVAIQQSISDVRNLSASTVIVSFYAKAAAGTPKLGVNLTQYFGTGGAPSADVVLNGQAVTLTTSWARYSVSFTVPTVIGKTLGSNGDSATILRLWHSAGTNFNTPAGSIGLQTATIDVTGVQVERSYLTPLEIRPINQNWEVSSNFSTWDTWTPQIRQGAAGMATNISSATYTVIGRTCLATCDVTCGANGTAGQFIRILSNGTLPTPRYTSQICGMLYISDVGTGVNVYLARFEVLGAGLDPSFRFYLNGGTGAVTTPTLATSATPDALVMQAFYEIA